MVRAGFHLLVVVGFVFTAPCLASAALERLERRMDPAAVAGGEETLTFKDLQQGRLRPPARPVTTHPNSMHLYEGTLFHHDGRPIFLVDHKEQLLSVPHLQRTAADFKGFHVHSSDTAEPLTIIPRPHQLETYVLTSGDQALASHIRKIDHVTQRFGFNVAQVAHGHPASVLPKDAGDRGFKKMWKKQEMKPPSWNRVHRSMPVETGPETPWQDLKQQLNQRRYLRFTDSTGRTSFGVRAHPDGRIERQLLNVLEGAPHVVA